MNTHPSKRDRIYLTGFMGSGKSTIGPILANSIGYDFADIDRMIELAEGRAISQIFRESGERYFRQCERSVLLGVCGLPQTVIALGGGTLVDPENSRIVRTTGVLIYLKLPSEEILRRLQNRSDRPLLTTPDGERLSQEELRVRIHQLYTERAHLYESADLTVLTDGSRVGLTVDRIVKLLAPLLR